MFIKNLELKNIGPFESARLDFAWNPANPNEHPVTIITGVNGAGKSIIIDSIRAALSGQQLERDIVADDSDFLIKMGILLNGEELDISTATILNGNIRAAEYTKIAHFLRNAYSKEDTIQPWIIDYWSSKMPSDPFTIDNLGRIEHEKLLYNVMLGKKSNLQLIQFLCHIDYLRSSDVPDEKNLGEYMYDAVKRAINHCLDNGEFKHIRRTDLQPVISQNGHDVTLDKLSSGNIFLIQHLVMLICKMYSLSILLKRPASSILEFPGLLLIDEIETHLHPRWQKSILPIIRELFPNLQIILTTHSPFVLSSLNGVKIYTCKTGADHNVVVDETKIYSHMPVDEILLSDAFNVSPFNNDITRLMNSRKNAIRENASRKVKSIEAKLSEINPKYFSYMNDEEVEKLLMKIKETHNERPQVTDETH